MYLLSFVTTTMVNPSEWPSITVSCLFSKRFHILIVLSLEPEIMYLLSFVTATVVTQLVCPSNTVSCVFSKRFHILIVLSDAPEIML